MLRPRRRLTKREIKEDSFVTFALQAAAFVQAHWTRIVAGLGAVVVIIVAGTVWSTYQRSREAQAQELLADANIAVANGDTTEAMDLYRTLTEQFSRTRAGRWGYVALGHIAFETGRCGEAETAFREYLRRGGDDPIHVFACHQGIAVCLEDREAFAQAAEQYIAFADTYEDSPFAGQALLDAARCLALEGLNDRAREALQRIITTYPQSQASYEAKNRMRIL
jgi:TolA-binding protein